MRSCGGGPARRLGILACSAGILGLFLFAEVRPGEAAAGPPTNEEYGLLVFANQVRADPSFFGVPATRVAPLFWSDQLGAAARFHSDDMASHPGCGGHSSCDGTTWWQRVGSYYPDWQALGENVVSSSYDHPFALTYGFLASSTHRTNLLSPSYNEFGGGLAEGSDGFGWYTFVTEDFGYRSAMSLSSQPPIPAGTVLPRIGGSEERGMWVNYYDPSGAAPKAVRALVGPSCVDLGLASGTPSHGTYSTGRTFQGSGCVPVVFEAIKANGTRYRWPEDKAILVGVGSGGALCAEWTTSVPTQDCGGGPVVPPTPTPGPSPTPAPDPDASGLKALHVVLKPGQKDASKAQVQVRATLPSMDGFDPSSGPVSIHIGYGQSGDWSDNLPRICGSQTCLKPNKRATVYRASWSGGNLVFTRGQNGRWKVRLTARNQTLEGLVPGLVRLSLTADGRSFEGEALGILKQHRLVAD